MKIDASKEVTTIKGQQVKMPDGSVLYVGDAIAEALLSDPTAGKMKAYSLATRFGENKEIEIDAADLALVKKACDSCTSYGGASTVVFGQILIDLENAK